MADGYPSPGYWQCPNNNCNYIVSDNLIHCPNCNAFRPVFGEFLKVVSSQQWTGSQLQGQEQIQSLQQYPKAHVTGLNSEQHHSVSSRQSDTRATTGSQHLIPDLYKQQCYFCRAPQGFTGFGDRDRYCNTCNKRQPKNEPQGPPCYDQECGARLLTQDARICARCGKQQRSQAIITKIGPVNRNSHMAANPSTVVNTGDLTMPIQETVQRTLGNSGVASPPKHGTPPNYSKENAGPPTPTTTTTTTRNDQFLESKKTQDPEGRPYRKSVKPEHLLTSQVQKRMRETSKDPRNEAVAALHAIPQNSMKLIFHVLIPKTLWEWDPKSSVHIRFGRRKLGMWKADCGPFKETRDFSDGTVEMTCIFETFDKQLLNYPVPYKYVVYSPKAHAEEDRYEYLHAYTKGSTQYNRCLVVPPNERNGQYHKYDLIAYPQNTNISKSFLESVKDQTLGLLSTVSWGFFGRRKGKSVQQELPETFQPLTHEQMTECGLECYLRKFREILESGAFSHELDIPSVATGIGVVYKSLLSEYKNPISFRPEQQSLEHIHVDNKAVKDILLSWFNSVINYLYQTSNMDPARRLLSATCIVYCTRTFKLLHNLDAEKVLLPLSDMLSFRSENYEAEYNLICSHIPESMRKQVASSISELCCQIAGKTVKSFAIEWLLAIPLYHFLAGHSKPFSRPKLDRDLIWQFYDDKLGLTCVHAKAQSTTEFVKTYYDQAKSYFVIDPLLLKLFVLLVPQKEFSLLCERIPPCLSAQILVRRTTKANSKELSWRTDIEKLTLVCANVLEQYSVPEYLLAMVSSSLSLCSKLSIKLHSCEERYVKLLCTAFSCALCAIEKAHNLSTDEPDKAEREGAFEMLRKTLNDWITNPSVIGGSVFGHPRHLRGNTSWKGKEELKVWQCLLSVDLEVLNEYKSVKDWHKIIEKLVYQRINSMTDELKIKLVLEMEQSGGVNQMLEEIIMDAALKAIDSLDKQHNEVFTSFANRESQNVGRLFGKVFDKHYPSLSSDPTLDQLFEWPHWPRLISICENKPKLKQGLSVSCIEACSSAKRTVMSLCERYQSGEVSVNEVQTTGQNVNSICHLFEDSSGTDRNKDPNSIRVLQAAVKERNEELDCFLSHQTLISYFCRHIGDVKGSANLQEEVSRNYSEANMSQLCTRHPESNQVQVVCFRSSGNVEIFAKHFHILNSKHGTDLFLAAWKNALAVAKNTKADLEVTDIHQMVWQPCLEFCEKLLRSLSNLSITVSDVDQVFQDHKDNLDTQLLSLCKGMTESTGKLFDWSSIEEAIKKIRQYWELCQYRQGATILLEIRDSLGLDSGDFTLVEKLSNELTSCTSGVSQTLSDIDDTLVATGEFLKDIVKNQRKVECLQSFARCQDIVRWLNEVTNDVNEIQTFVNVALATAAGGEGDLTHDKLSDLKKVGSGFASLIYNFPETAGFADLREACTHVWQALDKNDNLPRLLENCNRDVGWYQSIKETQGSVESTSYGQLRNILKYGYFEIGTRAHSKAVHSIHDLISLHLIVPATCEQVHKKSYNLDDLRDLESKLVLITGSSAENRTEVDHYLNILQYVTRIGDVLLALCQAGNVAYTGWEVTVKCARYVTSELEIEQEPQLQEELAKQLVADLSACAKEMENALKEWENEVKVARSRFYELNYFTTRQLLQLRKNLGSQYVSEIDPEILTLLQSISLDVTSENVRCILADLNKNKLKHHYTPSTIDSNDDDDDDDDEPETANFAENNEAISRSTELIPKEEFPQSPNTTSGSLNNARPKLTEDSLGDELKATFTDLVESQGYSKKLVLKAFESCMEKDKLNRYDILEWCAEYEYLEDDDDDDIEGLDSAESDSFSSSESSDEEFESIHVVQQPSNVTPFKLPHTQVKRKSQLHVRVIRKQIISESHPIVQKLIENDYDVEDSIDAVKRCGSSLQKAMDYLDSKDIDDESPTTEFPSVLALSEKQFDETLTDSEDIVIYEDPEIEDKYLSLDDLGDILKRLNKELPGHVQQKRTFIEGLKTGFPNLIVAQPSCVIRTALTLYMEDEDLPLPTLEEVLICDSNTTEDEINLLWQRAIGDPDFKRIFCLVHAERLSYQTCDKVIETLYELSQNKQDYRLVIVCSQEGEDKSHMISKLLLHKRSIIPRDKLKCQFYLRQHFIETAPQGASVVDSERSCVRVVSSERAGMGKSLFVRRMSQQLHRLVSEQSEYDACTVIPVHGPILSSDVILNFLKAHYKDHKRKIYHFDIAPSILYKVDTILFSMLILRGLTDSQGHVWRCHPAEMYTVEVTVQAQNFQNKELHETCQTQTHDLLSLLPTVQCVSPTASMESTTLSPSQLGMDDIEFHGSTLQRVYQYLQRHADNADLDSFTFQGSTTGTPSDCLNLFIQNCGVHDPSWSELHHFAKFLDIQLESCEKSVFFMEEFIKDTGLSGIKKFVVNFMITMSRDFATPSLRGEMVRDCEQEQLIQYEIDSRRRWEESSHPYIFFNEDTITVTFVGFHITPTGNLVVPGHEPHRIMTPQLYRGIQNQGVRFNDDYRQWNKQEMIRKLSMVMGIEEPTDPDETYVLTVDNLVKILAIQMRFRCGIPVVIMGETGCGKTRLIRYMCDLARNGREGNNMLIKKIHGGIKESDIIKFMEKAEKEAKRNKANKMDTVVFFDEANTTDAIGLIKEIMCDRRINGKPVSKDLKFIAACNPYKRHSPEMIKRLKKAGLGFYVEETKTQQRLGSIPLRELVYRVLELPPSMRPLVYDFGQLKEGTEDNYIKQIVGDHVKKHRGLSTENIAIVAIISKVLAASQAYMRRREDECSFVSLRDVERAMIVFEYFYEKIDDFRQADINEIELLEEQHPSDITSALILAVSICYHARLSQDIHRTEYEEMIAMQFRTPLSLPGGAVQFLNEIIWCQNVLLDNMEIGQNIAKNAALRENVFMMAICIELRIPLFLVGKPGSSKSLAKSIIQDSMHGKTSHSELLMNFKQVQMFSYQCSQLATPESVIEVFNSAKKFQSKQDTTQYVSVVVLDEVGLAEDSPNLPLKALHPLLEDGTEGARTEGEDEIVEREERVAFIGISNWALDPAKMNRGVMVTRGIPDTEELKFSAKGICGKEKGDKAKDKLEPYFKDLAEAYEAICRQQKREFFGLRDFYSLIKMLYWMCKSSRGLPLTWPQMKHAIMRNFGGLTSDDFDPYEEFRGRLNMPEDDLRREDYDEKTWRLINPDCTRLGLIKTSLDTKDTSFHGENRYLLFLTENYAALDILEHYIRGKNQEMPNAFDTSTNESNLKPFTLFGSSFPKDKEYTQVCRNINQIKICMETGRTVILLNLENLYESLYDVLNQYYMHYGDNRYVDLGLQTHRVKCRVHENFKLILIAERETVYEKFPTPLINRLEKHFVLTSSVLKPWQIEVLAHFQDWIQAFTAVRTCDTRNMFDEGNAFIGYQKDTAAAVVFQASKQLSKLRKGPLRRLKSALHSRMFSEISPEDLIVEEKSSYLWKFSVLALSQYLLLQTAADDALVRLKKSTLCEQQKDVLETYFAEQHHKSITDFVCHFIVNDDHASEGLLMQVTTHGHLLQRKWLDEVGNTLKMKVETLLLQEFDTELDFCNKVGPLFQREDGNEMNHLIVIQCDAGHRNGDLIACARYRIYDERAKALKKHEIQQTHGGVTHVLFIINLPHQVSNSTFVGFQGDPWISYHIDELCPTSEDTVDPHYALSASISELFIGEYIDDIQKHLNFETVQEQQGMYESEDGLFEQHPSLFDSSVSSHSLEKQLMKESSANEDDKQETNMESQGSTLDLVALQQTNTGKKTLVANPLQPTSIEDSMVGEPFQQTSTGDIYIRDPLQPEETHRHVRFGESLQQTSTEDTHVLVGEPLQQTSTEDTHLLVGEPLQQTSTEDTHVLVGEPLQQTSTEDTHVLVEEPLQQTSTEDTHVLVEESLQQTSIEDTHVLVGEPLQQTSTEDTHVLVGEPLQQTSTEDTHVLVEEPLQQTSTEDTHVLVEESLQQTSIEDTYIGEPLQQTSTEDTHVLVGEPLQQTSTEDTHVLVEESLQQTSIEDTYIGEPLQQTSTEDTHVLVEEPLQQTSTEDTHVLVGEPLQQTSTEDTHVLVGEPLQQTSIEDTHVLVGEPLQQTSTEDTHLLVGEPLQQTSTEDTHVLVGEPLQQTSIEDTHVLVGEPLQQTSTEDTHVLVGESLQQTSIEDTYIGEPLQQTSTEDTHVLVEEPLQQTSTEDTHVLVEESLQQTSTEGTHVLVGEPLQQTSTEDTHVLVEESLQQTSIEDTYIGEPLQQTSTEDTHVLVEEPLQQTSIEDTHVLVGEPLQQTSTEDTHVLVEEPLQQTSTEDTHVLVEESLQQTSTEGTHVLVGEPLQQTSTEDTHVLVGESLQQTSTEDTHVLVGEPLQQTSIEDTHVLVGEPLQQTSTEDTHVLVGESLQQTSIEDTYIGEPLQQTSTEDTHVLVEEPLQQTSTEDTHVLVEEPLQQTSTEDTHVLVGEPLQQTSTEDTHVLVEESLQQTSIEDTYIGEPLQQTSTEDTHVLVEEPLQQTSIEDTHVLVGEPLQQTSTEDTHVLVEEPLQQTSTEDTHVLVEESLQQTSTEGTHVLVGEPLQQTSTEDTHVLVGESLQQTSTEDTHVLVEEPCQHGSIADMHVRAEPLVKQLATTNSDTEVISALKLHSSIEDVDLHDDSSEEMKVLGIEDHTENKVAFTRTHTVSYEILDETDLHSNTKENPVLIPTPPLSTCDSNSEHENELLQDEQISSLEPTVLDRDETTDYFGDQAPYMSHSDDDLPNLKYPTAIKQRPVAQCRHLHTCIQAAVSRIKDTAKDRSTQIVALLTKLIPRDPSKDIDFNSFYGILIIHLYKLLREREELWPNSSEWVLEEALNSSKLETGGTFRNVLGRKIDEVVVVILSKIIACIDINYNLDLVHLKAVNSTRQFWLSMFRESGILQLKYSDMIQGEQHTIRRRERVNEDFKSEMPFSWLIKDTVDSQWDNAKSRAGDNMEDHHYSLCKFVEASPVGKVLEQTDNENCEMFYMLYLHDFVRLVHEFKLRKSYLDEAEYKLVSESLNHLVNNSKFELQSLVSRIAALHIVHWMNRSQILWFSQLVAHSPSIITPLLDVPLPKGFLPQMELHLNAAIKVMELKEPPLEKNNPNPNLTLWLNDIRLHRSAICSILNLKSSSELANKARHYWQRLQATQLFVEHVMLRHPSMDLKLTARRLSALWKEDANFLKASTVRSIQVRLTNMERMLKKDHKDEDIQDVKKSCRRFFMDLVTTLCFGGNEPPEQDLIKNLLDTVFVEEKKSTQDLTPYKNDKVDKKLTFRSTLLQLLLQHSTAQVKDHLRDYLERSHRFLLGKHSTMDPNLFLLIAQCFEDSIAKQFGKDCLANRVHEITSLLTEGHIALQNSSHTTVSIPSLEYLEGVAKIRFSLSVLADFLKKNEDEQSYKELLEAGRQLCLDHNVNCIDLTAQNAIGPVVYLIKLIVRQYGMPCINIVAETHQWVIPAELKPKEDERNVFDPFVIYGDNYKQLRESIRDIAYGAHEQTDELVAANMKVLGKNPIVYFLLALYEKVTLSQSSTSEAKRIAGDVLDTLDMVVKQTRLNNEQMLMARALLANQQGGRILEQMTVSPQQPHECQAILDLVVHTAAVFFHKRDVDLLHPFISIFINPAALHNLFLPTMPEDQLEATITALKEGEDQYGNFYSCPRGHRYFVGNCGRVYSVGVCNVCHLEIGGKNHKPLQGNTQATLQDTTKTGHDLGEPHTRVAAAPERGLTARAVCILRALMHSAFVWACCNNDQALGAIAGLVHPYIQPNELPEFFWTHLQKDVELLGQDTGKGLEDSVMMIHLVLKQILSSKPPVRTVDSLETKAARQEWETSFSQCYIQPVLSTLTESLHNAFELVLDDKQQELDQIFLVAHEKLSDCDESIEHHLWTYRARITLEHLRQSLHDKQLTKLQPILYEFLQAEADLRATQYLPDIARLQKYLYSKFNHQIDKISCKRQTVGAFIDGLCDDGTRVEYRQMVNSLLAAWSLVSHKLKNHGPLPVEEQYYIPLIDDNTPMEFLIPTTSEAGVCTTALVHYLVSLHNSFIERCRSLLTDNNQDISLWRKHKVPITHLHRCHLVDYEDRLNSIILSHSHYSLRVGKGQNVTYDYTALQKQIVDQFIHGKPVILLDIPQVVYRNDIYNIGTFGGVRGKVPQERLPQRVKQDIIAELRTPVRLREALDVVEIVLGFLSSGGGRPEKPLGDYIDRTLKMKERNFSSKAKMTCQLKHALSLWETIAVELARQLCLMGQEPFDSIPLTCLRELSSDEDGEDQFAALDHCLGQFDPDTLLGTLYEFIETYVKHSQHQEHDEPLVDTLEAVFESDLTTFPTCIKLNQAVSTWKHIVHHYASIEKLTV